jgi:hypothetical protein
MIPSGESIRVVHPLFQVEGGGSIPTSPLQLIVNRVAMETAIALNYIWHSRLPEFRHPPEKCIAFSAEYADRFYAVAIWSQPTARALNHKGMYELRRMAISDDAPRNTASRMLSVMRKLIARLRPDVQMLISYQDADVHAGTIYKAAGWEPRNVSSVSGKGWNSRSPNAMQSKANKVRWECAARCG